MTCTTQTRRLGVASPQNERSYAHDRALRQTTLVQQSRTSQRVSSGPGSEQDVLKRTAFAVASQTIIRPNYVGARWGQRRTQKIPMERSMVATGRNAQLCWRLQPLLRSASSWGYRRRSARQQSPWPKRGAPCAGARLQAADAGQPGPLRAARPRVLQCQQGITAVSGK